MKDMKEMPFTPREENALWERWDEYRCSTQVLSREERTRVEKLFEGLREIFVERIRLESFDEGYKSGWCDYAKEKGQNDEQRTDIET